MAEPRRRFEGLVVQRLHAKGTKSGHDAILLETREGTHRLRRAAGTSFDDPKLQAIVGKRIACVGSLHQGMLIIDSWEDLDQPGPEEDASGEME